MLRLRGVIYLVLSSYIIWHEFGARDGSEWIPMLTKWAEHSEILSTFVSLLTFVVMLAAIVYWAKGINFVFISGNLTREEYKKTPFGAPMTFSTNIYECWAEDSRSRGNSNIDRVKEYRDSKFSTMSNETRAEEYRKTAWIDGLESNKTKNASRAREYINAKMTNMDNESAYKWLKGE